MPESSEKIAVIGLGYVGLPLLLGLAKTYEVTGFDIDAPRVSALQSGEDWTGEGEGAALKATTAQFTADPAALRECSFFIVTVPTPIDQGKRPDLRPLTSACQSIGAALKGRTARSGEDLPLIVFESTVWPGLTEQVCGPLIEDHSGLTRGTGFRLGYSPERINPGDKEHRLETIVKIISAEDGHSLARLAAVYGSVVGANLYRAASIKVAEAAKVLENTQRDLNIALMNEMAVICDRMDIRTYDVLDAAGTKWNFLKFTPGLVGGHCIGVDPSYLTSRAEELGYHPQVVLAGRRINDAMPVFIAQKIIKLLARDQRGGERDGRRARVGILGVTFKENVRDIRNSRVPEIAAELASFGAEVAVHDPLAEPTHAQHEYGLTLQPRAAFADLDALVLAVPHRAVLADMTGWLAALRPGGWLIDVKSAVDAKTLPTGLRYWSL